MYKDKRIINNGETNYSQILKTLDGLFKSWLTLTLGLARIQGAISSVRLMILLEYCMDLQRIKLVHSKLTAQILPCKIGNKNMG